MNANMTAQPVADALLMAVWRRGKPGALMHHSDQWRNTLRYSALVIAKSITVGMFRKE
jgi:putative transposase